MKNIRNKKNNLSKSNKDHNYEELLNTNLSQVVSGSIKGLQLTTGLSALSLASLGLWSIINGTVEVNIARHKTGDSSLSKKGNAQIICGVISIFVACALAGFTYKLDNQ